MALKRLVHDVITAPSARDEQRLVGPSDLGYRCDFCLGLKLTRMYPQYRPEGYELRDNFGLKAWMGTAIHGQLEAQVNKFEHTEFELRSEITVPVYNLANYGLIKGHVDLVCDSTDYLAVVDFKTTDKSRLRSYKLNEVPDEYVFQLNLYGYGVENQFDRTPDDVGISFIPRDSNNVNDIWTCFAPYNRSVAEMALVRLEEVWEQVQAGNVMELEHDAGCWDCGRRW